MRLTLISVFYRITLPLLTRGIPALLFTTIYISAYNYSKSKPHLGMAVEEKRYNGVAES